MLRWRNLGILFVVDDILYVLSAATIKNKHEVGAISEILLVAFLIGAATLLGGLLVLGYREWRSTHPSASRRW
jgi:vacuolar-type H+-ATPase subunit I/STV1